MLKKKMIISRYNENISWVDEYKNRFDHIIYNKGDDIHGEYNVLKTENIGNNQRDIFKFICENYESLPDVMIFIQGNPFDHCKKEKFDRIIDNNCFTPLESYEHITDSYAQKKDADGGYMEINNSWYISAHNSNHNFGCIFESFDSFMNSIFTNYESQPWNRFSPGSQYIITKAIALYYPKKFWEYLMNVLHRNSMTEGHIIERAMMKIFQCNLTIKENLK